ncbi:MAG TPA: tetratricopeptide repeat protein [Thermoflexia bacterium]|nr:tetratricopeptide repeat protein [Thermoflexia bacterium]
MGFNFSSRRRRRRSTFWRALLLLCLNVGGLYFIYASSGGIPAMPTLNTPTPMATPTRAAISFAAEAADLYWEGKLDESIAAYRAALDLEPEQLELYVALARLLILRGHPAQGLDLAREVLRRDPENAPALAVLCLAYDWLGLPGQALETCDRALAVDPSLAVAYAYRAEAYMDVGNWAAANVDIEQALSLDNHQVDVLRNAGYVMEVQGNYSAAIQQYREALEQHGTLAHIYLAIGRNYEALGRFPRAVESYELAIERDPGSVAALDRLGWSYLLQGESEPAQQVLATALDLEPHYWPALGHLATYHWQRRNYEGAIPLFKDSLRYGEAASRRQTIFFRLTLEPSGQLPTEPTGEELAGGTFLHPADITYPLRAMLQGLGPYTELHGYVRLTPLDGHYILKIEGLPDPPAGHGYVGWFEPLLTPEKGTVHTPVLRPDAQGVVVDKGATGAVSGPPIESYYTLALCYYFLDECDEAEPYIHIALRIAPDDANTLETQRLCQ